MKIKGSSQVVIKALTAKIRRVNLQPSGFHIFKTKYYWTVSNTSRLFGKINVDNITKKFYTVTGKNYIHQKKYQSANNGSVYHTIQWRKHTVF